ncbi:MAG TPA: efflux RND transporter periplasmic adaptor subunit [Acidobacteriota bacterium]|nr:efflux RND transporter periplasmic adaptor subunit [Acidobacteriota bacterium]
MDIPRESKAREKKIRRIILITIGLVSVLAITLGLSRLKPAAPSVERSTVWIDTVKRGAMIRQVRGTGTLVPTVIQWIPATTDARVDRILILPGTQVKANSVLLELNNPELVLAMRDAELDLKAGEADFQAQRVKLENDHMDQVAAAAAVKSDYLEAKLKAEADEALAKEGLVPELTLKISKAKAEEMATRNDIEAKRLEINEASVKAQVVVLQAHVDQLRAQYQLKRDQVEGLRVRAGVDGVLQQLPVQVGQRVTPGTTLAKVAQPEHLKAELKIAETQAKDIQIGQSASVDTRNGVIVGHVTRVDPAVQNGTVTVDVGLDGVLPKGARPDLTVDGTVELDRLQDVMYVGRPTSGQENDVVGLFKLDEDGGASRIKVKLGKSSVNTIEILDGLRVGDQVILSDMSAWDAYDRIRLK